MTPTREQRRYFRLIKNEFREDYSYYINEELSDELSSYEIIEKIALWKGRLNKMPATKKQIGKLKYLLTIEENKDEFVNLFRITRFEARIKIESLDSDCSYVGGGIVACAKRFLKENNRIQLLVRSKN